MKREDKPMRSSVEDKNRCEGKCAVGKAAREKQSADAKFQAIKSGKRLYLQSCKDNKCHGKFKGTACQ